MELAVTLAALSSSPQDLDETVRSLSNLLSVLSGSRLRRSNASLLLHAPPSNEEHSVQLKTPSEMDLGIVNGWPALACRMKTMKIAAAITNRA